MKKGTKVTFNGKIVYYQDFSLWGYDFGDKIFTFVEEMHNGLMIFESDGYGIKENYGNGKIYINKKYLKKKINIKNK